MFDYIIIGSGIIGFAIARELKYRECDSRIAILEKEKDVGYHASGRNSGVLHSGFYYTEDSLKAKFTKEGNFLLQKYCAELYTIYFIIADILMNLNLPSGVSRVLWLSY